ncbi:nicotinate-nucleotide--dimethylbenzimidazole phosphoribosyltransferase [Ilumatobacter sp.]|uniref:nicotinate-nucleotide--dimethylbenzimidazole phosphoribosyltransferase n=1 Tax=Ilumatobacter sp. TaxID=1967498 RepID=UPI003AF667A7
MSAAVRALLIDMPEADLASASAVRERAEQVLRPGGALQRLDDAAVHVAAWRADPRPSVDRPAVLVFAGDHGIAAAGVSKYPPDVTAAMLSAVEAGRATINAFARSIGATLDVVDVGVGVPTCDIRVEPAMSAERFDEIADTAIATVDAAAAAGADLVVLGELGIGNTTIAAALPAALIGGGAARWVGRGTGIDDDGLDRKLAAVEQAVERIAGVDDPIEIMRELGGAELTAMAVACARARRHRIPVVLDGYIAAAAVLPLHVAAPAALDHCLAGHVSAEPGHRAILEHIGKEPLLDLGMRLGEGSGAAAAVPLIRMACAGIVEVATFDEWFDE